MKDHLDTWKLLKNPNRPHRMTCGISGFVHGMASASSAASGTCSTNPTEILEKAFLQPTNCEFHTGQKQTIGTSNLEAPGFHPKSLFTCIKIHDLRCPRLTKAHHSVCKVWQCSSWSKTPKSEILKSGSYERSPWHLETSKDLNRPHGMTCGISNFVDGAASAALATCHTIPAEISEKAFLKPTVPSLKYWHLKPIRSTWISSQVPFYKHQDIQDR